MKTGEYNNIKAKSHKYKNQIPDNKVVIFGFKIEKPVHFLKN